MKHRYNISGSLFRGLTLMTADFPVCVRPSLTGVSAWVSMKELFEKLESASAILCFVASAAVDSIRFCVFTKLFTIRWIEPMEFAALAVTDSIALNSFPTRRTSGLFHEIFTTRRGEGSFQPAYLPR